MSRSNQADRIEIRWPGGQPQIMGPLQAGREYEIRESSVSDQRTRPAP